jgi:hypothetical protein
MLNNGPPGAAPAIETVELTGRLLDGEGLLIIAAVQRALETEIAAHPLGARIEGIAVGERERIDVLPIAAAGYHPYFSLSG